MLNEMLTIGEVLILAMLKNEHSTLLKKTLLKYQRRYLRELFQRIWRISKYEIKLLSATFYEPEHVTPYAYTVLNIKFLKTLPYEVVVLPVCLY